MKLEFNTRKNMTTFDYYLVHINSKLNKVNDLLKIRKIVKNWFGVLLFRLGLKKTVIMYFRDDKVFEAKSLDEYFNFWNTIEGQEELFKTYNIKIKKDLAIFKFNNKVVKFHLGPKYPPGTLSLILGQFIKDEYNWLVVKGKVVIDIGANIGDTAIYFALKGAKQVYSFEPYPYSYEIAKKNIKLNRLENKITLLNEGVGGKSMVIKINPNFENTGGSDLKEFQKGKKIRIITLEEIIKRFSINHAALKIDCEGCEYASLLSTSKEVLSHFDQIIMEYHYGYKNLVKKLKEVGFKVKHSHPVYGHNTYAKNMDMYIGMIYAEKI